MTNSLKIKGKFFKIVLVVLAWYTNIVLKHRVSVRQFTPLHISCLLKYLLKKLPLVPPKI